VPPTLVERIQIRLVRVPARIEGVASLAVEGLADVFRRVLLLRYQEEVFAGCLFPRRDLDV